MSALSLAIIILIVALVLHLIEEVWTGFRVKLPIGEMPKPVFIGVNVAVYAFCLATLSLALMDNALVVPFAWVLALAMLINGGGHIGVMVFQRRYFPGGFSAFLLLGAAGYLVAILVV